MAQHYDVAVLGSQPAGIIAAALVAKRGKRVLLLGGGDAADDGTYASGAWRLPRGPQLMASLERLPAAQRVHDALGIGTELRAMARPAFPTFQGIVGGHRLALGGSPQALGAELCREFPTLARPMAHLAERLDELDARIGALLSHGPALPPPTPWAWPRARLATARLAPLAAPFADAGPWDGIPTDHPLRALLAAALPFFGHLRVERPSVLHAARLLGAIGRGAASVAGGRIGLRRLLLAAARRAGVELNLGARLVGLTAGRRRIHGMTLAGERQAARADLYVDNTGAQLAPWLPDEAPARARLAAFEARQGARGTLCTVNLVVAARVVPRGMAAALLLADAGPGDAAAPPLWVERHALGEGGRIEALRGHGGDHGAPHEVLNVTCPVAAGAPTGALAAAVTARLAAVIPYLESHLVAVDTPATPAERDAAAQAADVPVDADWDRPHPLWGEQAAPWLGAFGQPARTPVQNLLHCGASLAPGLGAEGAYIAGLAASQAIEDRAGRRWF